MGGHVHGRPESGGRPGRGRGSSDAGYDVTVPYERACCGLTWITTGQLDGARARLRRLLDVLAPYAGQGTPIVGLEPSCVAVLRSDLLELLPDDPRATSVARAVVTLAGSPARSGDDGRWAPANLSGLEILVQPHCHQHAVMGFAADRALLARTGAVVTVLAGCCGLAGNFGMERGHYEMSVAVAENALLPALRAASPEAVVLADGFSCRTQIQDLAGRAQPDAGAAARRTPRDPEEDAQPALTAATHREDLTPSSTPGRYIPAPGDSPHRSSPPAGAGAADFRIEGPGAGRVGIDGEHPAARGRPMKVPSAHAAALVGPRRGLRRCCWPAPATLERSRPRSSTQWPPRRRRHPAQSVSVVDRDRRQGGEQRGGPAVHLRIDREAVHGRVLRGPGRRPTGRGDGPALRTMIIHSDDEIESSLWNVDIVPAMAARYGLAHTSNGPKTGPHDWGWELITADDEADFLFKMSNDPQVAPLLMDAMANVAPTGSDGFDQPFGLNAVTGDHGSKQGWTDVGSAAQVQIHSVGWTDRYFVAILQTSTDSDYDTMRSTATATARALLDAESADPATVPAPTTVSTAASSATAAADPPAVDNTTQFADVFAQLRHDMGVFVADLTGIPSSW